jgi:hypothetical protein
MRQVENDLRARDRLSRFGGQWFKDRYKG